MKYMYLDEARKISDMCVNGMYPPMNPAVLLRAMYSLYLNDGISEGYLNILRWLIAIHRKRMEEKFGENWISYCI